MCLNRPLGTLGSPERSRHRCPAHVARAMLRQQRGAQQRVDQRSFLQGTLCSHKMPSSYERPILPLSPSHYDLCHVL